MELGTLQGYARAYLALAYVIIALSVPVFARKALLARRRGDFECKKCGTCCRFTVIKLTGEDVERIKERGFDGFYEKGAGGLKLKHVDGRCVFQEGDECMIHDFKPAVCTRFPFYTFYGIPMCRMWRSCPGVRELAKKK